MTKQISEEYYQIGNFVDVITLGQSEAAHKYTTIDGWKGFRFCCPICGDRDRGKKATIFPRMTRSETGSNYLRWHYLCKGHQVDYLEKLITLLLNFRNKYLLK